MERISSNLSHFLVLDIHYDIIQVMNENVKTSLLMGRLCLGTNFHTN